jgi:hypothetical protein
MSSGAIRGAAVALAMGLGALGAAPAAAAPTAACAPVAVASDRTRLPPAWLHALDALVEATAQEGLPWSCPGGSITLTIDPASGGVLTFHDARGRSVSRPVATPDDLVPTGEALLAAPLVERAPPPDPAPSAPVADAPERRARPAENALAAPPRDPRVQIQAAIGPRVSGPGAVAWIGGQAGALLPFGPWSIAFWARYDVAVAGPPGAPSGFSMSAVSAGVTGGRRLYDGPFELRVLLSPSIAAVMMEAGDEDEPHPEGTKVAFRIGTGLAATFRIASIFRGAVTLDGEFAPAGITGLRGLPTVNGITLPPVPVYTGGLLLGVEALIR